MLAARSQLPPYEISVAAGQLGAAHKIRSFLTRGDVFFWCGTPFYCEGPATNSIRMVASRKLNHRYRTGRPIFQRKVLPLYSARFAHSSDIFSRRR